MFIAKTHKFTIALVVGALFLIGGIAAGVMIRPPMWYNAVDFIFAYIPMAWIGAKLGGAGRRA